MGKRMLMQSDARLGQKSLGIKLLNVQTWSEHSAILYPGSFSWTLVPKHSPLLSVHEQRKSYHTFNHLHAG